ncbi:MAG TPA: efflux RND transporter periplasmic adaptor subunit [Chthoniobacterales bacterium]|nr:efflux RND transporter periplasmic adaptor subunit [Chthoniobacterales bacterium]
MKESILEPNPQSTARAPKAPPKPRTGRFRFLRVSAILVVICAAVLAVLGITARLAANKVLQTQTDANAQMVVTVVSPERSAATVPLQLPGETRAYTQAPIFAQTSGYVKKWYFDIGAKVKSGEVLAELDTPEVDQQLNQARANLKQAQAALDLSRVTYDRNKELYQRHVIAGQDIDNSAGDFQVKEATVAADAASVKRLEALEDFKLVRAPFDGIVISRNTDVGALVNSGSGNALFTMAQTSPLRIYVTVPEGFSHSVHEGTQADLSFNEFPNRHFAATVVRTAGAIDPTTRTLLTELQVPNESGELFPGAYAQVRLQTESADRAWLVPANVLLFREEGASVGIVKADGKVEIRPIKIGRDLGSKLEVVDGLAEHDRVVVNPSDSLANGMVVQLAQGEKNKKE